MISFEFPVTERVRLLLRLEDLFARLDHHLSAGAALDHHAALLTLFDLAELGGRVDIKGELLQELERQKQLLDTLRDNPAISETALESLLAEIDQAQRQLLRQASRLGHSIRENEWLSSIRQRAMLAGGVSRFELPAYHSWLSLPDAAADGVEAGHHHHDHDADEVFTSWGVETAKKFSKADIEHALTELDGGKYGMILRSKGIVDGGADGWLEFDYVPGEWEVRQRGADVGGKLVVIGSKLDEKAIAALFGC